MDHFCIATQIYYVMGVKSEKFEVISALYFLWINSYTVGHLIDKRFQLPSISLSFPHSKFKETSISMKADTTKLAENKRSHTLVQN